MTPRRSNIRQCSKSAVRRTLREVPFGPNNRQRSFVTKQRPRLPAAAVTGQTIETRTSPSVRSVSSKTVSLRRNTLTSTVD